MKSRRNILYQPSVRDGGIKMKHRNRGYFGIGVYHPKTVENIGTLWRSAYHFGASFIFTIGRRYKKQASDTPHTTKHIPLLHFLTYDDFYKHIPYGARVVCVEQHQRAQLLPEAHHPQQAIYLLGAEDYGLPEKIMSGNQIIEIPTGVKHSLNVAVAGSLVMYDRFTRAGYQNTYKETSNAN